MQPRRHPPRFAHGIIRKVSDQSSWRGGIAYARDLSVYPGRGEGRRLPFMSKPLSSRGGRGLGRALARRLAADGDESCCWGARRRSREGGG